MYTARKLIDDLMTYRELERGDGSVTATSGTVGLCIPGCDKCANFACRGEQERNPGS
jgi:hypothetical protein